MKRRDSVSITTPSQQDTLSEPTKTYTFYNPLQQHGSLFLISGKPDKNISKWDILDINYTGLPEILAKKTNAYSLSLGNAGMFNHFSFMGALPNDVSIRFNGRNLNDLEYGSLNLEQIPVEFLQNIEIVTGSEAAVLSGSSGALINLQEISYNTSVPYTRLWYSQAGYEFLASDGVFSQNIAPNWNLALGFRGMSAIGRFDNSWLDSWNLRGLLRWSPSDLTTFSLSNVFSNHGIGTNGGIDYNLSSSYFDEISAIVNYDALNERNFRHDLTFSMTSLLDKDSLGAFTGSLYLTNNQRNINRPDYLSLNESDTVYFQNYSQSRYGVTAAYEQKIGSFLFLKTGGEAEIYNLSATPYFDDAHDFRAAAYGHIRFKLPLGATLSGGARIGYQFKRSAVSFGARFTENIRDNFVFYADLSINERLPNPIEGLHLKKEANVLAISGISYTSSSYSIDLSGFARRVQNPIVAETVLNGDGKVISTKSENLSDLVVFGGALNFKATPYSFLGIEADISAYYDRLNSEESKLFPNFTAKGSAYYKVAVGRSELKAGISSGLQTGFSGYVFLPITRGYYLYPKESKMVNTGLNVFLAARLGEAYVRLELQNALSQGYYSVPVYPAMDMNFRVTISWAFMD